MPKNRIAKRVSKVTGDKKEPETSKAPVTPPPRPKGINQVKDFKRKMGDIENAPVKPIISQEKASSYDKARGDIVIDGSVSPKDLPKMSRQVAKVPTEKQADLGEYWKDPASKVPPKKAGDVGEYWKSPEKKAGDVGEYWKSPKKKEREASVIDYSKLKRSQTKMIKSFLGIRKKLKKSDQLPGGLADNEKPESFDQRQLEMGIRVELEHTDDPKLAMEIAMDHLKEHPQYYTHLSNMEQNIVGGKAKEVLSKLCKMKKSKPKEPRVGVGISAVHRRPENPNKLAKGKMGDWKKEGYWLQLERGEKNPNRLVVQAHHPQHGIVGEYIFNHSGNQGLYVQDATTWPEHKRKGLATSAYQLAEKHTGRKIENNPGLQSPEAKQLWAQENRPFGKSLRKGLRGNWEKEGYDTIMLPNTKDKNKFTIYATHPDHGDVGYANFTHDGDVLRPDDNHGREVSVYVDNAHRRKGLASAMYNAAEKQTGKKIIHSDMRSEAGGKFIDSRAKKSWKPFMD